MVLTSSSFSSKYWSHWSGTTSLKPSRKALVWPSTPRENLHSAIKLQAKQYKSSLICTLNDIQRWGFFLIKQRLWTWCTPPYSLQWLGCWHHWVWGHERWSSPRSPCPRRRTSPDRIPRCCCPWGKTQMLPKYNQFLTHHGDTQGTVFASNALDFYLWDILKLTFLYVDSLCSFHTSAVKGFSDF